MSPDSDSRLQLRFTLMSVGSVLALVGLYLDQRHLITLALAVLVVGFSLRFLPRRD